MIRKILLTVLFIGFGAGAASALPSGASNISPSVEMNSFDEFRELVGAKKYKRAKRFARRKGRSPYSRSNSFKGRRGGVKDTCPGGDHGCIKDLKANCDKAKGGLSTEPDGGVDCFVVGIHDQPDQSD